MYSSCEKWLRLVLTNRNEHHRLHSEMRTKPVFDVAKLQRDIDARGWLPRDLARAAAVSDMTVSRALNGTRRNPRTWDTLARALGYTVRRYLISEGKAA